MNEDRNKEELDTEGIAVLIPFPDFEKLKTSVEKLRIELSMLFLEVDELYYVVCKNIEMAYMLSIGDLEYKAYEIECAILRMKRKAELIQAKNNRQEKVILSKIEKILDSEFAEYEDKLDQQVNKMNAALAWKHGKSLSEKEKRELKKLYRSIVKLLHPDIHPNLGEEKTQLFHNAVRAYKNRDINELRIISTMVTEPIFPEKKQDVISQLVKDEERLSELLQIAKDRMLEIKSQFPYTMRPLIESPERIEVRRAELEGEIQMLNEMLAAYTAKMKEMLG